MLSAHFRATAVDGGGVVHATLQLEDGEAPRTPNPTPPTGPRGERTGQLVRHLRFPTAGTTLRQAALESAAPMGDNQDMANDNSDRLDALADLKEVARQAMSGGIRDPEVLRRVRQRAERARAEVLQKFGIQEIGVQIIREMRDAE